MTHNKHLKFVGYVTAIDTYTNMWSQRITHAEPHDFDGHIDWHLTYVPLPPDTSVGHYISVHRTKAGEIYAVNLSHRMPPITESQIKRAEAEAKRLMRLVVPESDLTPTEG